MKENPADMTIAAGFLFLTSRKEMPVNPGPFSPIPSHSIHSNSSRLKAQSFSTELVEVPKCQPIFVHSPLFFETSALLLYFSQSI
jgi:hypothetical protein